MFGSEADSYDRSTDQLRVCGGGAGLTLISHRSVLYEGGQQRKCELSGVVPLPCNYDLAASRPASMLHLSRSVHGIGCY